MTDLVERRVGCSDIHWHSVTVGRAEAVEATVALGTPVVMTSREIGQVAAAETVPEVADESEGCVGGGTDSAVVKREATSSASPLVWQATESHSLGVLILVWVAVGIAAGTGDIDTAAGTVEVGPSGRLVDAGCTRWAAR